MNRKRVAAACLAAVLLGADMISITVPNYVYAAESEDYDQMFEGMRSRWRDTLLGGSLDPENPAVQAYIENINETANEYWNAMIKSSVAERETLWEDLDMSFIEGTGQEARMHTSAIYREWKNQIMQIKKT